MKNLNPKVLDWFQQKIIETYSDPEIRIVKLPPKVEWKEKEVPYEVDEERTRMVDGGPKSVVYIVPALAIVTGVVLFFLLSTLHFISIILAAASITFFAIGMKKFRISKEEKYKVAVTRHRIEKESFEIPQSKEEAIPGEWAIRKLGTGSTKFRVDRSGQLKLLTALDPDDHRQTFKFPDIKDKKKFVNEFSLLEQKMENIPFVLSGEKETYKSTDENLEEIEVSLCGLEKEIMDFFIDTEYTFSQTKKKEVHANLFTEEELKKYLVKTNDTLGDLDEEITSHLEEAGDFESTCKHWLDRWPEWVRLLKESRVQSVHDQVIPEFKQFSNQSHYSSFNFYCPDCNKEISEELMNRDYSVHSDQDLSPTRFSKNTRCQYILGQNAWQCPMCEKITLSPIPLHKALDEILLPVYDKLMEENKTEREKDYSDVRKKEIHYKNEMKKELESMFFDNLNAIIALKDDMEKMHAEIDGESEAIQFINESIVKYKNLQSEIINNIESSNEEMKVLIESTAQKILADVDRVKNREMELLNKELTELSKAKRLDDERRDSVQRNLLEATYEQTQVIDSRMGELTDVTRDGLQNVSNSVQSLEETNRQGFEKVSAGISQLDNTTREGFKNSVEATKEVNKSVKQNNAMQAARNEKDGISPYDDSSILRPMRSINRGLTNIGHKLTGKSSTEAHIEKLETVKK